jgi:hypothetical protein
MSFATPIHRLRETDSLIAFHLLYQVLNACLSDIQIGKTHSNPIFTRSRALG